MASKRWSENLRHFLINATQKDDSFTENDSSKRLSRGRSTKTKKDEDTQKSIKTHNSVEQKSGKRESYIEIPENRRVSLQLPPSTTAPSRLRRDSSGQRDRSQGSFRSRDPSLNRSSVQASRSPRRSSVEQSKSCSLSRGLTLQSQWANSTSLLLGNEQKLIPISSATSSRDITDESWLRNSRNTQEGAKKGPTRAHYRRSVQAGYNFQIPKEDLNENMGDVMMNLDIFSEFAKQHANAPDEEFSTATDININVPEEPKTPTNQDTPEHNLSKNETEQLIRRYSNVAEFDQISDCSLASSMTEPPPDMPSISYQGICHLCREEKLATEFSRKTSQKRRGSIPTIVFKGDKTADQDKIETIDENEDGTKSDEQDSSDSDTDEDPTICFDADDPNNGDSTDGMQTNQPMAKDNLLVPVSLNTFGSSSTLTGSWDMVMDDHPASRLVELFKDDMEQLIHIVLHHIPPVIPIEDGDRDDRSRDMEEQPFHSGKHPNTNKMSLDEEIEAIERKIAFLKELVMANGSYRQNLLKSLKTAITLNTTFLILSHLSV